MDAPTQSAAMQFIAGFISGPPIWVWPLLVVLLILGWRASKPRQSSIVPYYFLPLLGVMSMQSIGELAQPTAAWAAFTVSYLLSTVFCYRRQSRCLLGKAGRRLSLAGEWMTMTAVMVVFWSNFAKGTLDALAPQLSAQTGFCVVFAAIVGTAAGSFLGRSLYIIVAKPFDNARAV